MRSDYVTVSVLALLIVGMSALNAQPKGERITIKGEVVDLWCFMEGGDRGPDERSGFSDGHVGEDRRCADDLHRIGKGARPARFSAA